MMETKINKYFIEEKKVTEQVAKVLGRSLLKYEDIAAEFCFWLDNRTYRTEGKLIIGGYSALEISEIAPHLDAAGVYNFMVTMRDDPEKAERYLQNGFPTK